MTPAELADVMEATWPPARSWRLGPFLLRDGAGGGKRVSAASAEAPFTTDALETAIGAMEDPLFLIRAGDAALDHALAALGFAVVDPVVAYAAPVGLLADPAPEPMAAFAHWPPLQMTRSIWAEGGIGPARLAVMDRVTGPKTALLARTADQPAGAAFVAIHGKTAMLHALEVRAPLRRQGSADNMLRAAAVWAQQHGADRLALVVTERNDGARRLYASKGMQVVGQYHYRQS